MNQQKLYEKAPAYVCGESFLSDDDIISLMTLLSHQKGLFTPKSGLLLVQLRYRVKILNRIRLISPEPAIGFQYPFGP